MVKDFLSQKGIAYEDRDVSRNRAYAQELVNNTGQMGVPVTVFNGQVVVGFDRPKLEQLTSHMQAGAKPSFGASIADAAKIKGSAAASGAYIGRTRPGSVAQKMGLQPGDIITWLNSVSITGADDFERALSNLQQGSRLSVVFLRGNQSLTAEAVL
jgi:S1-C subfamily serine protease